MAKPETTAKRSKVPDYATMVPAGTVIGIPIGDERWAFGRVLSVHRSGTMVVEVFRKAGRREEFDASVLESGFAVPPFVHTVGAVLQGAWPVVHRDERFELAPPESELQFVYGVWPFWHAQNVRQETTQEEIPGEEAARRLPTGVRGDEDRAARVAQAIREGRTWTPGEPDPEWAASVRRSLEKAKQHAKG
ncbi:Imm26 family immunity protein [Sorangium sp. So ce176]|uniref:Imm26 family immunity protein n=1 Tax=Sorangium sp. So ce176 TaxID=3133286 RepID=UPI003F610237